MGFGIVRSVNSGDSVSIFETTNTAGPPPVRDIFLSNVQAPKLGYNSTPDAPWSWQSKEFLRELCVGKKVKFTVEHKTGTENPREYGSVVTDTGVNLGEAISEAGWALIRSPPDGKDPRTDEHKIMLSNQERAKTEKRGIYQENSGLMPTPAKLSTMELFDTYKNTPTKAFIEYVRDANIFNVILLDSLQKITLRVAGISAPRVPSKARQESGEKAEPFALEAKFFVERHLLQRSILLTITSPGEANRQTEFFGSIEFAGHSLASQLLKNGYATLVEWSAPPNDVPLLKKCQEEAKIKKLRVHRYAAAVAESPEKRNAKWTGKVREIRDGSSLVIQDSVTGESKFVIFSNVKVPRMTRTECQPYAYQARELLRKKVLGKNVSVILDYSRESRDYATVLLDNKSVALLLVESGYANVVSYDDNEKSSAYQLMTIAENRAKASNKNLWNKSKAAPVYRVTDTTLRSNDVERKQSKQKAKQFYSALQRAGRVKGIVEHVFNGNRVKISVPKQNCIISFGLEGIRGPNRDEADSPLNKELFEYAYDKLYQHDVELIVESTDQAGNFFGSLFLNNSNFGVTLLEMGYVRLNQTNVDYTNYASEYRAAEESAKSRSIRIWLHAKNESAAAVPAEGGSKKVRVFKVSVSEVVHGNSFFLQMTDDAAVLDKIMTELNKEDIAVLPSLELKKGTLYAVAMSDGVYYRVKVLKQENSQVTVLCVDFGNTCVVEASEMRPLPSKLNSAPIQARECKMAYIQVPSLEEDYGEEAAEYFYQITEGKDLVVMVESSEGGISLVRLADPASNRGINSQMVSAGFGILESTLKTSDKQTKDFVAELAQRENEARKRRLGRWEHGDCRDEDF